MELNSNINIYTSYLSKMSEREKTANDVYIQVSRSVFCPKISKNGVRVTDEIDLNFGEYLGNYEDSLEAYYNSLTKEVIDNTIMWCIGEAEKIINEMPKEKVEPINIFLLCHENLEAKYKASSFAVKNGLAVAGEWQVCHRRVLADYIRDNYGLFIPEYGIKPENEGIVYRQYF